MKEPRIAVTLLPGYYEKIINDDPDRDSYLWPFYIGEIFEFHISAIHWDGIFNKPYYRDGQGNPIYIPEENAIWACYDNWPDGILAVRTLIDLDLDFWDMVRNPIRGSAPLLGYPRP